MLLDLGAEHVLGMLGTPGGLEIRVAEAVRVLSDAGCGKDP